LLFLILILKSKKIRINSFEIVFPFLYFLFISLLLGERNVFFSFMLIVLFFSYRRLGISKNKIILSCLVLVLMIPILGQFKNVFTRTDIAVSENIPIGVSILNGEFRSAGYNINYILNQDIDLKYGASILSDFSRALIPRFIYPVENSIGWYNNTFHPNIVAQGRGYGFSLAAEGYVNFGYFGVYLWFFIVGGLIVFLNNKSYESNYYFMTYLLLLPIFVYAIRGDMSTIMSPLVKQICIPYFLLFIIYKFLNRIVK